MEFFISKHLLYIHSVFRDESFTGLSPSKYLEHYKTYILWYKNILRKEHCWFVNSYIIILGFGN